MTVLAAVGSSSPSQFALQVVALITGGGIIQLIVYLLKRRSEITALDRTSAEPLLTKQDAFIDRLQLSEVKAQGLVAQLEERIANERRDFTSSLAVAHRENDRISAEVARIRTDLDIAARQVEELRRRLAERG